MSSNGPFRPPATTAQGGTNAPVPAQPERQGEAVLRDGTTRVFAFSQAACEIRWDGAVKHHFIGPTVTLLVAAEDSVTGPRRELTADEAARDPRAALDSLCGDGMPGEGQPEEALELVRRAARRASVFGLAATMALGRHSREDVEEAVRLSAMLEVLRQ